MLHGAAQHAHFLLVTDQSVQEWEDRQESLLERDSLDLALGHAELATQLAPREF